MARQTLWVLRKGIVWQYVTSSSAVAGVAPRDETLLRVCDSAHNDP